MRLVSLSTHNLNLLRSEVADEDDQDGAVSRRGSKELLSGCSCERAHGTAEEKREQNKDTNSFEGVGVLVRAGKLPHHHDWYDEQCEHQCGDEPVDECVNTIWRVVSHVLVGGLFSQLVRAEDELRKHQNGSAVSVQFEHRLH